MMIGQVTDRLLSRPGKYFLEEEAKTRFGTRRIMAAAKRYNRWRYAELCRRHQKAYRDELPDLLRENGGTGEWPPRTAMKDGWAIDTSKTLPHLDRLLEQGEEIVREREGRKHSNVQQLFLRDLWFSGDEVRYPAVLDFITSSEVLSTAIDHLGTIPLLSKTRPRGIRFMESNAALDPGTGGPYRDSQCYHLDVHDNPLVYVLVLIRDVTPDGGPWTFLPASVSERACHRLGYREKGMSYRVADEDMYRCVRKKEAIEFSYPKGTVLFIDSSRCFHFGSRNAFNPRFQLMYALTTPCRGDFSMTFVNPMKFPLAAGDSRLRRMVLE